MATDAIVAIQDMGAAGLTSSSVEMSDKGGVGDRIRSRSGAGARRRDDAVRNHAVRKPGTHADGAQARARGHGAGIFEKWELDFAVIGRVTDTNRLVLKSGGDVVCDIPVPPLVAEAPEYERPWERTPPSPGPVGGRRAEGDRCGANGRAGRPGRIARSLFAPLGVGTVRPHGHGRHGAAARRRRGGGPRTRHRPRARHHHGLHAALLRRGSGRGRAVRPWRRHGAT